MTSVQIHKLDVTFGGNTRNQGRYTREGLRREWRSASGREEDRKAWANIIACRHDVTKALGIKSNNMKVIVVIGVIGKVSAPESYKGTIKVNGIDPPSVQKAVD